jgi:glyoxylase-like metal-dependent hydrolase (beta-lactamase superfamily II)
MAQRKRHIAYPLRLSEEVFIVGSGRSGLGISDDYDCHVYLINGGESLGLIDAGGGHRESVAQILSNVRGAGFDPARISTLLLTHVHADHSGGAHALKQEIGLAVCISSAEASFLLHGDEQSIGLAVARTAGFAPPNYRFQAVQPDRELNHGDTIGVGSLQIKTIWTPGHSRGSLCYLLKGKKLRYFFSGDMVFLGGLISLLNCPGTSLDDYRRSMRKLEGLRVDSLLPGHGGFCLRRGQSHIAMAIEAFQGLSVPRSMI